MHGVKFVKNQTLLHEPTVTHRNPEDKPFAVIYFHSEPLNGVSHHSFGPILN